jgi:HD superfamily phosphodiesterase
VVVEINKDSEVKVAAREAETAPKKAAAVKNQIDYDKIVAVKSSECDEVKGELVKVMENRCAKEKGFSLHRALCCLRTRRTS